MFIIRSLFFSYHAKLYYLMGSVRASIAWNLTKKVKDSKANLMGIGPGYVPICLWTEHYESRLSIHTRCAKCTKYQIFGIFDIPNTKKIPNIRCSKSHNFYNILQYPHIFSTVWTSVTYDFIIFLFLFLSHPNYLFRFLLQLFTVFSYSDVPSSLSFFFLRWQVLRFFFFFFEGDGF